MPKAISFEDVLDQVSGHEDKVVFTGNPRAQEVSKIGMPMIDTIYGLNVTKPIVLIFGGSRGAAKINEAVIEAYPRLVTRDYQIIFVTGEHYFEDVTRQLNAIAPLKNNPHFVVKPYIHNMINVLRHSSLIISRSGATTIAEITVLGVPSILIPSPNVTEDHQTKNAMSLVNNQAAILLKEEDLNAESFLREIDYVMTNSSIRQSMGERALELGQPFATDQLIQVMLDEIRKKA